MPCWIDVVLPLLVSPMSPGWGRTDHTGPDPGPVRFMTGLMLLGRGDRPS